MYTHSSLYKTLSESLHVYLTKTVLAHSVSYNIKWVKTSGAYSIFSFRPTLIPFYRAMISGLKSEEGWVTLSHQLDINGAPDK